VITRELTSPVLDRLAKSPAVVLLGVRQVGKTTLSEVIMSHWKGKVVRFDLEDPDDVARLADPKTALNALADHLVVIDELHRMPGIFPLLRVLIDRDRRPGRFLLLGSSSPEIAQRSGGSLAGRVAFFDLWPLSLVEVGHGRMDQLWVRGGHPDIFLA
jgi:predicted AAA+ superfamily ATPase